MRCRMGKESSPAKVAPAQSVRFLEKHNPYSQPPAKQLLDGEPTHEVLSRPNVIMPCSDWAS